MSNTWYKDYDYSYQKPITKIEPYQIETFQVDEGDVILLHLSDNCTVDMVDNILREVRKTFPNNKILIANEYLLQGLTILKRPPKDKPVGLLDERSLQEIYPDIFSKFNISLSAEDCYGNLY